MKKILIFAINLLLCTGIAGAAVRDGTSVSRTKSDKTTAQQSQSRISTSTKRTSAQRQTALQPRTTSVRAGLRSTSERQNAKPTKARSTNKQNNINYTPGTARATTDTNTTFSMSNTRVGAEYTQCKNTYFACMDQFCSLKNDDYRRCSCNDRVFKLAEKRATLTEAGEKLTVFTENLDVVGMTAAQAAAMRNESEGESALTNDNSASKALLQAIMNSIRGEDSNVGGRYSDLNSITISFDTTNAFGMTDIGQAIASYNGNALYSAVYPQCRNAVRNDCNDASLQRAVTAYLMAIEQDCNTVQTAIENTQKEMKNAVREGSAMLDLARVENRKKHNSSDITTCINEVESAILSEEVCGENYHKCLDNGEYIDIATGKPIIGVKDFYKLEQLLSFREGVEAANQKLAQQNKNRIFVSNFEKRTKKFAANALDKCRENADTVWAEYLDKAMLEIYYAQRDKVSEIKQGCFEYISACYVNTDTAIKSATSSLKQENVIVLHPDTITLTNKTCTDYINSCDSMFDNNIIQEYVANIKNTDTLTACRAVVKQCFDRYGGTNYENFYYPYSGLFETGRALDWFTLYDTTNNGQTENKSEYISECAKQLQTISTCNDPEIIEQAFGGMNRNLSGNKQTYEYGLFITDKFYNHEKRSSGVATEVFNQIISTLTTQCTNMQGRFVEQQNLNKTLFNNPETPCLFSFNTKDSAFEIKKYNKLISAYNIANGENACPFEYELKTDVESWGTCSCWENGARRSKNGKSTKCFAAFPVNPKTSTNSTDITDYKYTANGKLVDLNNTEITDYQYANDTACIKEKTENNEQIKWSLAPIDKIDQNFPAESWCTQNVITQQNTVCPLGYSKNNNTNTCQDQEGTPLTDLPVGL